MNPWERDWSTGSDAAPAKAGPWEKDWATPVPPPDATALDRAQAAGSGVNRFAVNLAGAPVATALNVWDLAKAGAGVGYHELTGKPVPDALTPTNREQTVGSPEWIAKKIEEQGAGSAISPNRPDDTVSRYLHAAGQGVGAGLVGPASLPQALTAAATGGATMLANQYAGEHGASPATQALISTVLPSAGAAAATRTAQAARAAQAAGESAFTQRASQNAVADAALREAQDAGYKFPPAQINPSLPNKILGGVSGKAATEQAASLENQPLTNSLARRALGLADDVPLSHEGLVALRKQAGDSYDAVKGYNGLIHADDGYLNDLIDLHTKYQERLGAGSGEEPMQSLRLPAVEHMLDDVVKQKFSPTSAVELIKRFRRDADGSFRAGNSEAAGYQKGIASAIEDLVGRNLDKANQPELLANFQNARRRIAQSYDVQDALNPATGNVDARKLAAADRADPGKLSGELKTIANAGGFAPLATREFTQTPPGISALDVGLAAGVGGGAAVLGHGAMAAIPLSLPVARMAARKAILSSPYQQWLARRPTSYQPSILSRSLAGLNAPAEGALPLTTLLGQQ